MPSNKAVGNHFEADLCEILFQNGFWAHNMAQTQAGQPADVIAVKNQKAYLIDCKVCTTGKGFDLRRVEDNQEMAMTLWRERGNKEGWFAIRLPDGTIHMVSFLTIRLLRAMRTNLTEGLIRENGWPLKEWILTCE